MEMVEFALGIDEQFVRAQPVVAGALSRLHPRGRAEIGPVHLGLGAADLELLGARQREVPVGGVEVRVVDHGDAAGAGHGQAGGAADDHQPNAGPSDSGQQRLGGRDELALTAGHRAGRADHDILASTQLGDVLDVCGIAGTGVGRGRQFVKPGRIAHDGADLVATEQCLGHHSTAHVPGRSEHRDAHGSQLLLGSVG